MSKSGEWSEAECVKFLGERCSEGLCCRKREESRRYCRRHRLMFEHDEGKHDEGERIMDCPGCPTTVSEVA